MKDIEKYVGYYLGVYVVVLAICGFFQYFSNCQGQSLTCAVTSDGIEKIITVTAYVLTPIIAIIGFLNWKQQHNKLVLADEAKKLLLAINDDVKLFTDILGTFEAKYSIHIDESIYCKELSIKIQKLSDNISNVCSKAIILSELTDNKALSKFGIDYAIFIHKLYCELSDYFTDEQSTTNPLQLMMSNHTAFFSKNEQYKKLAKEYILAK